MMTAFLIFHFLFPSFLACPPSPPLLLLYLCCFLRLSFFPSPQSVFCLHKSKNRRPETVSLYSLSRNYISVCLFFSWEALTVEHLTTGKSRKLKKIIQTGAHTVYLLLLSFYRTSLFPSPDNYLFDIHVKLYFSNSCLSIQSSSFMAGHF